MNIREGSIAEVRARFSRHVREAEHGDPIVITRHGRPVAALVRAEDVRAYERLRAAGPEGGLASVAGGWDGSDELAGLLDASVRLGARDVGAG
ncbi:MAG: type II toxin-antitoxin system Phd/YefM family antitoxin [Gemmatimonadota bacterium]